MANILAFERQVAAVHALCEGTSIRAVERMTGIHRDTVMRLGVRVGQACAKLHDETMRELKCEAIEADEVWGFVGKKERTVDVFDREAGLGDVWTFVGIDPATKLVPSYVIGRRDRDHTREFVGDLARRIGGRIQLSTDGMQEYAAAVEEEFGPWIDYGQVIKQFGSPSLEGQRRYSPPAVTGIKRKIIEGMPAERGICTSHVEKQNLTMRTHIRRLTRLTNAFSKKLENFRAAVALHFAYYNFVRVHGTIRTTPAVEAGVARTALRVEDLVEMSR